MLAQKPICAVSVNRHSNWGFYECTAEILMNGKLTNKIFSNCVFNEIVSWLNHKLSNLASTTLNCSQKPSHYNCHHRISKGTCMFEWTEITSLFKLTYQLKTTKAHSR